jgi:molecular chaperone GrpE
MTDKSEIEEENLETTANSEQEQHEDTPEIEEQTESAEGSEEKDTSEESENSEEGQKVQEDPEYIELNNKYLRLYAEFDNFRRRSAKESLENYQNASAKIIGQLLPTLENFARAFSPEHKASTLEDFEPGIQMIYNNFKDVLEEAGLEEINPEGEEFDPNLHEALMKQPHDTVEEDHVVQVFQKGYKLKDKILKHAQVVLSQGKAE